MKLRILATLAVSAAILSSCGALSSATGSSSGSNLSASKLASLLGNSTAASSGSTAGVALASLAAQYLGSGSLDLGKAQNVLNVVSLLNSVSVLKDGANDTVSDFTTGLVSSSQNLVNSSNSSSVVSALVGLANLDTSSASNALQKGKTAAQEVSAVKSSLEGILQLFKK